MSVATTTTGGMVVVTHVYTVTQGAPTVANHAFSKGYPLVLGTVMIMTGLISLLAGIPMAVNGDSMGVVGGVFVWGALMYITAGSLTVAAGKFDNTCLVKGALGVSVVAALCSIIAVIFNTLDAFGIMMTCSEWIYECNKYRNLTQGFSGVLAVFHFLTMAVSLTVSGFACNATCSCCSSPQAVIQDTNPEEPKYADPTPPPVYSTLPAVNPV